jgi:hypothetical protein
LALADHAQLHPARLSAVDKLGILIALSLWMVMTLVRKREPGFRWQQLVADYATWQKIGPAKRAARTTFFLGSAVMFICLGALIGIVFAYFTWRIL